MEPIGADPEKFDVDHTDDYGVGAFLLVGSEIYRMNAGRVLNSRPVPVEKPQSPKPLIANFDKIISRYQQVTFQTNPDWSQEKMNSAAQWKKWFETLSEKGTWADLNYEHQDRAF